MSTLVEKVAAIDPVAAGWLRYNVAERYLKHALYMAMVWGETPQGYKFWEDIFLKLDALESGLLPTPKPSLGHPGRNQGRKRLSVDSPTVVVSIKMTAAQRDEYKRKGGAAWVRKMIDM